MRKIVTGVLVCCILIISTVLCFAENRKDDWKDSTFDFKTVRKLSVEVVINDGFEIEEFDRRKLDNIIYEKVYNSGKRNIVFIPYSKVESIMNRLNDVNLAELRDSDPEQYAKIMQESASTMVDAFLCINIRALHYEREYVPEYTRTYTENEEIAVLKEEVDSNGEKYTVRKS